MKILVLGGYGIFGARLCELLAPDPRISLLIAGRSLKKATALCQELSTGTRATPVTFDRNNPPDGQLQRAQPDLVIDASGPFQFYGENPYQIVEACLRNGINYMDFADGSDFVKGIGQFDHVAKERKLYALSGVSSFPVLTAAVVRRLSRDTDHVLSIRGGIAPSPYAGFGMNVIKAISAYAGKPIRLIRGGSSTTAHALTETLRYTIGPPGHLPLQNTRFSLVDVPDLQILPELWPDLEDIWMGAGPVPEVLHRMLNGLAWMVRLRLLPSLSGLAPLFCRAINILRWGEHRGGMFVETRLQSKDGRKITRTWHLLAEGNDGPYIPCMALEAIIKRSLDGKAPDAGARPASRDLELEDYERLFEKRTIFTGEREYAVTDHPLPMFQDLLGHAWNHLPEPVRDMHFGSSKHQHDEIRTSGMAAVERGRGWLSRTIAAVFGFPSAGQDIPVTVAISRDTKGETWVRTFAGKSFSSRLTPGTGKSDKLIVESFGPFSFGLALVLHEEKLNFVVRNWKFGPLALPARWAPGGNACEYSSNGKFHFNIEIRHAMTDLIVKYSGYLARDPIVESSSP